jgi:hypothetical protein
MTPFWQGFLLGGLSMFVWIVLGLLIALIFGEAARDNPQKPNKGG